VVGCELGLDGGDMEREGFLCPCPGRASACKTGTERRQRASLCGRGLGTVPVFAPALGAVFALDFDFDLVVGRLHLSFFFGVEVFPHFCFLAETSMSRVNLNSGSGFSRDGARVTRTKFVSESGAVLDGEEREEEGEELEGDKGASKIRASWR
jgi:hypothetical protein